MASDDTDMPPYTNTVTKHAYTLLSISRKKNPSAHQPRLPTPHSTLFEVFRSCKVADVVRSMTLLYRCVSLAHSHCHLNSDQLTFSEPFSMCVCVCVCERDWGRSVRERGIEKETKEHNTVEIQTAIYILIVDQVLTVLITPMFSFT